MRKERNVERGNKQSNGCKDANGDATVRMEMEMWR